MFFLGLFARLMGRRAKGKGKKKHKKSTKGSAKNSNNKKTTESCPGFGRAKTGRKVKKNKQKSIGSSKSNEKKMYKKRRHRVWVFGKRFFKRGARRQRTARRTDCSVKLFLKKQPAQRKRARQQIEPEAALWLLGPM